MCGRIVGEQASSFLALAGVLDILLMCPASLQGCVPAGRHVPREEKSPKAPRTPKIRHHNGINPD